MPVDMLLPIKGLEGESKLTLDALVARLRRHSGGYVLTSVSHGARVEPLQRTLQALANLGVREAPDPARSAHAALDDTGLALVRLESTGPAPAALLLVGAATARWPLLPAVQKVSAAARLTPLKNRFLLFAADGTPTRAVDRSAHREWILIET